MRSFRLKANIPGTFPLFVYILVNILTIFYPLKLKIRAIPSPPSQQQTKKITSYHKRDVSRFLIISSDEIHELKSVASNKNTSPSTKQWMNVFRSWCECRDLEYVSIETMAPEELDKVLNKFYAEVKKKDGDNYEPESLSFTRNLQCESNFPASTRRGKETQQSSANHT